MKGGTQKFTSPARESPTKVDDPSANLDMSSDNPHPNPDNQQELGDKHDDAGNSHAPASPRTSSGREAEKAQANKANKPNKSKNRTTQENVTIQDLFGVRSDSWTRYFAMTISGDLDNVEVFDELYQYLPDNFDCTRRTDGSIIIDAKTKRNSTKICQMQTLRNCEVTTTRDLLLNSKRGTILIPPREFKSTENLEAKILRSLKIQDLPVSKVRVFEKSTRRNKQLLCACITFDSRSLPSEVRLGFEYLKVREDIPRPRQCRKCWKFGHPAEHCRGTSCCPICGAENHTLESCPQSGNHSYKGHCPNCNTKGHTAFSKECVHYKKELEVLTVMYNHGIPKDRARRIVNESGMFAGVSYARKAAPRPDPPRSPPANSPTKNPQSQPSTSSHAQNHKTQQPQETANSTQAKETNTKQSQEPKQQPCKELSSNNPPPKPNLDHDDVTVIAEPEKALEEIFGKGNSSISNEAESDSDAITESIPSQVFAPKTLAPKPQRTKRCKNNQQMKGIAPLLDSEREPFLSMEEDSADNPSGEVDPSQSPFKETGRKRKPDESPSKASTQSSRRKLELPYAMEEALQMSSPKRQLELPSPLSQVQKLDDSRGAITKHSNNSEPRVTEDPPSDGQHSEKDDCGCNQCIRDMAIVRNVDTTPGKPISKSFRLKVSARRIYRSTSLKNHPTACLCKTHMDRMEKYPEPSKPKTTKQEVSGSVASLLQQFEKGSRASGSRERVDPRTGKPPPASQGSRFNTSR